MERIEIMSLRSAIVSLKGRGLFSGIDIHFADFIAKAAGDSAGGELYLAAALLSHTSTQQQHVCLNLKPDRAYSSLAEFFPDYAWRREEEWDSIEQALNRVAIPADWPEKISGSGVVGLVGRDDAERFPLVIEGTRLYLQRYWKYEKKLAALIRGKAAGKSAAAFLDRFAGKIRAVSKIFQGKQSETDWQLVAAFAALHNHFTVITGGPGTGKTTVVTAIIALLLQDNPELRISLCAPTGKAQARLQEAMMEETARLNCDRQVLDAIGKLQPSTIHRLLGVKRNTPFFWRNAANRLDTDLLIVDEVSMVSQPLMAKLLMAAPAPARIILLGDKDQLASVEIGSILGDICAAAQLNRFSRQFVEQFRKITGADTTGLALAPAAGALVDSVVALQKSHRFRSGGGISNLKEAVNANRPEQALKTMTSDPSGEVACRDLPARKGRALLEALAVYLDNLRITVDRKGGDTSSPAGPDDRRYRDYTKIRRREKAAEIDEAYRLFREAAILCPHRGGTYGVENINRLVREILEMPGHYCRGLPIMVNKNDYQLNLFNGDVGLCWPDEEEMTKIHFPNPEFTVGGGEPKYRAFLPSQLPEHEVVFAMTVHKAQGSGFQRVLLIMPDKYSPILTAELVYTGITRARTRVEIWTDNQVFRETIAARIRRNSGLREALQQ